MKTSVPIYLEERDGEVLAHPLFDHALGVTAPNLDRALQRLQPRLLMAFQLLAVEPDQRGLAACPKPNGTPNDDLVRIQNFHARAGARLRRCSDSGGTHASHSAN